MLKSHEIIKNLRLEKNWSQKDVAEKLNISVNGYSKMERGKSSINTERLNELAAIFDVSPHDLLPNDQNGNCLIIKGNNNNNQHSNFYHAPQDIVNEIEKLQLKIQYQEQLLQQQARELQNMQNLIDLLKQK
ncbi:helix-turn-helix domain-containing protein [Alysiella filiformis DSM 16848]|uniref:Helix-turn-helix n=1 Tax=Alysiella filiformis DSM 16848 TaxID=1120981 RepID=A0A286E400_9NEIS|nr:helix-turn-helix transcriptional regulator [Alysiella filiformis]UBQ55981.1 helix-turn-helix domain-containing protein [Alysiella filiformis DSM 16848]SOD65632.1 Helix-turn-helix [Alysiella filiformis DSM 16848]